jgi:hypothetical protein
MRFDLSDQADWLGSDVAGSWRRRGRVQATSGGGGGVGETVGAKPDDLVADQPAASRCQPESGDLARDRRDGIGDAAL